MPKSNDFITAFLQLIFNAVSIPNIARDNILGSLTLTVALHTASPGVGGTQLTNEISYTGYSRVAVNRDASGWTVSGQQVAPASSILFPAFAGGIGGTVTHFSVGTGVANAMLFFGTVSPNLVITSNGAVPELTTATALIEA